MKERNGVFVVDMSVLKEDFYKRFGSSDQYLIRENCGLLCTLLGFTQVKGALCLTYPLSFGITALCRASDSNRIELENTDSDFLYTQSIKNNSDVILDKQNLNGGQILFHNEIPEYFDFKPELKCCILKCVMHMNDIKEYNKTAAAASCCGKENIKPYIAHLNGKDGYCILSDRLKTENLPLPLMGFKIVAIQLDKNKDNSIFENIEKEINKIRDLLPHMTAISDINESDLCSIKKKISSIEMYNRLKIIIKDNARIKTVASSLRTCRTSELFNMMNLSAKDFLQLWGLEKNEAMLLRTVLETEGVRAARFWNKGVVAVVYEERVDYVVNSIKRAFMRDSDYDMKFCISK